MAVERAPYINYTDITTYQEVINNGSETPLFVVKTNNVVNVDDITPKNVKKFVSYGGFKEEFSIPLDEEAYNSLDDSIKSLDKVIKDFFLENSMYVDDSGYGLAIRYVYVVDVGNAPTLESYLKALTVTETKKDSTVTVFMDTEDIDFMNSVKSKLLDESKNGLLRIAYFGVKGQGEISGKYSIGDVLRIKGSSESYTGIVEGYKHEGVFYEEETHTTEITPTSNKIYLNKSSVNNSDAYTYDGTKYTSVEVEIFEDKIVYESDDDYKFIIPSSKTEVNGGEETFNEYCKRCACISRNVGSSRVAIVEKEHLGKTIARICSTPYYVEPGYLPYLSVRLGVFEEYTKDDRDALFGTGLIFNEDDYTLQYPVSRICLATSTGWGIADHDMRTTDSLLHARRNVDYHVRNILNIIAPQLKRNETSVNLRYVKNQIDLYLQKELLNGTIVEYSFDIYESSYNPYTLLVRGRITPVNSTLAIEFENSVGSPYMIASDYV